MFLSADDGTTAKESVQVDGELSGPVAAEDISGTTVDASSSSL